MEITYNDQQNALFQESFFSKSDERERRGPTAADRWNEEVSKHALDELINLAQQYTSSKSYKELIDFVSRFRFYKPYNAMLVHIQMPGATFVAPAHRWIQKYGRTIRPDAHPLVILQPMGPVMFVFDVGDTEAGPGACPLPPEVEKPFEVRCGQLLGKELERTIENAKRDGIRIMPKQEGSQSAGSIGKLDEKSHPPPLTFETGKNRDGGPIYTGIPVRYNLVLNEKLSREAKYATLVHELAHLYCGHLGTPNNKWWPDRRGLTKEAGEFEAESATYLLCRRVGIDNPSERYLAGYRKQNQKIPEISLECIMKAGGLIEKMGKERIKPRKDGKE